jgi:hypothetical protein
MMSHQTPKVMSFLPRSRASACSTRASVTPESGFRVVTTQRGTQLGGIGRVLKGSGAERFGQGVRVDVVAEEQDLAVADPEDLD